MSKLPDINISQLLEAGVHFGHKTSRWNPKMAPYIFKVENDIHIINLEYTVPMMKAALKAVFDTVKNNGRVLFIGTKIQASSLVAGYAEQSGQYFINHRWLGGMLTNWGTVSKSIKKLDSLESILSDEERSSTYTKKELLDIKRKCDKLSDYLGGIRKMGGLPDIIIVIDINKERLAIKEAQKLGIPIIAIVDSNADPEGITYPVPGNDDAIRSIEFYCQSFANAALTGIEEALLESGVDLGTLSDNEEKLKAARKVVKLKSSPNKQTRVTGQKEKFIPDNNKSTKEDLSELPESNAN